MHQSPPADSAFYVSQDFVFRFFYLETNLGIISKDDFIKSTNQLIKMRIADGLNYISLSQLCAVGKENSELTFQNSWIRNNNSELSYFAHLASCFQNMDTLTRSKLIEWSFVKSNISLNREAIRNMRDKWTIEEKQKFQNQIDSSKESVRSELIASFSLDQAFNNPMVKNCMNSVRDSTASERDNRRWNCFNSVSFQNIHECQTMASNFETEAGLGAQWYCLKHFANELSISTCKRAASAIKQVEKSDDILLGCWERLQAAKDINRSECLRVGEALQIEGNKIKQNWNCVNQISN